MALAKWLDIRAGTKIWLGTVLFVVLLVACRIGWLIAYMPEEQTEIQSGVLDLRMEGALADTQVLSLNGEWEFYPHALVSDFGSQEQTANIAGKTLIQVPGEWTLEGGSYGYGTYRLQVLLPPQDRSIYSLKLRSVIQSSALYINGKLLGQSGKPAASRHNYEPYNNPYTVTFSAEGAERLDIALQVANYDLPSRGGIARSILLGKSDAVDRQTGLSMGMIMLVSIVYLLHGGYAFLLYAMGMRDRRLLFFALSVIFPILAMSAVQNRILLLWGEPSFELSVRHMPFIMVSWAYSILQCVPGQYARAWARRAVAWISRLCLLTVLLIVVAPPAAVLHMFPLYFLLVAISIAVTFTAIWRTALRDPQHNGFTLLGLLALIHCLAWEIPLYHLGNSVVFYPFDLLIAIICFSAMWFQRYFQGVKRTRELSVKLKQADEQKDEFLANTSHELRNPLHGMLAVAQAVLEREGGSLQAKSVRDMELMLDVGRRMTLMLNDLLDIALLKESGIVLQRETVHVQTAAGGVLDMLRHMSAGKPVVLRSLIPDSFPPVMADEKRLIQILFNLVHNALKHTSQGAIEVSAEAQAGWATIRVRDTGTGMPPELQRRVFEPYEQAEASLGGFGLGLHVCRQLVELHGGVIRVRSEYGKGAEFSFTMELASAAAVAAANGPTDVEQEGATSIVWPDSVPAGLMEAAAAVPVSLAVVGDRAPQGRGQAVDEISGGVGAAGQSDTGAERSRLLIVDDDAVNLNVLVHVFDEAYQITVATGGSEALRLVEKQPFDLMISDVMMPGMSGYELTRLVRSRYTLSELPILLLTARERPEDIETGFRAGANDYVTKPVNLLELRARVTMLTRLKQSVGERLRMEGAWLQAQIKPHFILNTFNAVAALSQIDLRRMQNLVDEFSNYLRVSIDLKNLEHLVPLEQELELVRSYLYIEQERFGDRLQVKWEIEEGLELKLPPLSIQPLVENAVRHGILSQARGGCVAIRIASAGDPAYVEIVVEDEGRGMSAEQLERLLKYDGSGIGVINTDRRLKWHFGNGLHYQSRLNEGTRVSFVVKAL